MIKRAFTTDAEESSYYDAFPSIAQLERRQRWQIESICTYSTSKAGGRYLFLSTSRRGRTEIKLCELAILEELKAVYLSPSGTSVSLDKPQIDESIFLARVSSLTSSHELTASSALYSAPLASRSRLPLALRTSCYEPTLLPTCALLAAYCYLRRQCFAYSDSAATPLHFLQ